MFVVSIIDHGHERNLVATKIRMESGSLVVHAGDKRHVFSVGSLIEIAAIEEEREWSSPRRCCTSQLQ
ncbi:hypothetical protein [Rhizobium sp. R693]|uniref:hypothetical protein n=1 Tax=Rhizobium sp. R693 TaxID=1764276 RepID=UPI000B52BD2C|nr:hypothetical protein [Rhizobium sp. R693]OWV97141.1 hypothetical protein ATY79_22460 [Rhizobium sp. R693]